MLNNKKSIDYSVKLFGLFITFVTVMFNSILVMLIFHTTIFEKWSSKTKNNIS